MLTMAESQEAQRKDADGRTDVRAGSKQVQNQPGADPI